AMSIEGCPHPPRVRRRKRFLSLSREETGPAASVLCLVATLRPGMASHLCGAVLARLAESADDVGTVVLAPEGDIDTGCLASMCVLHESLHARGIQLRLVIGTQEMTEKFRASAVTVTAATATPAPAVHPSLRAAMLAAFAALPGPGLVNSRVRASLAPPVEELCLADEGAPPS
ncbi:MAG: hypothetical protein ACRDN0_29705, partial [Trebonia sp.]